MKPIDAARARANKNKVLKGASGSAHSQQVLVAYTYGQYRNNGQRHKRRYSQDAVLRPSSLELILKVVRNISIEVPTRMSELKGAKEHKEL